MASVGNQTGLKARASQDETAPFPLEHMLAAALASRRTQDETAPFPLEFEVVARRARRGQDETAPFPLEFVVTSPEGESALVRVPREHAGAGSLPALKWRGLEASRELREYAARVASGEDLPPYRGPILAGGAAPWVAPRRSQPEPPPERSNTGTAFVKLALGFMLLMTALVASAVLGDDAQLRAAGESLQRWFTGESGAFQAFPAHDSPPPAASAAPAAR